MLEIVYVVIMLLASAFFTGAEIAFFSLDEIELLSIIHSKHKNAKLLQKLNQQKESLLISLLICTNAINLSASALNTYIFYNLALELGYDPNLIIGIVTFVLTVVLILFGEALPKIIGINYKRSICIYTAPILYGINYILKPIVKLILIFVKLFSQKKVSISKPKPEHYQKAFMGLTDKSVNEGLIGKNEGEIIKNAIALGRSVDSILKPRSQVFALRSETTVEVALMDAIRQKFSRFPIFEGNLDNITGVVNIRQLLTLYFEDSKDTSIKKYAVAPIFVQETWTIWHVLNILKKEKGHLAVVIDEFGGMTGIVTMEDILEELVGDIQDEKDPTPQHAVEQLSQYTWQASGSIEIHNLNKALNTEIPLNEEFETLQGFIMDQLKKIPKVVDMVIFEEIWHFNVIKMQKNQVKLVKIDKIYIDSDKR